jgi:hypothetical protein
MDGEDAFGCLQCYKFQDACRGMIKADLKSCSSSKSKFGFMSKEISSAGWR